MPKSIVICCDGTNNSLVGPKTNIAHLHELAGINNNARQLSYYDAGVGVEAEPGMLTRLGAMFSRLSGSAFGTGLVENVEQAYLHLIRHFETGDRVFLFGFSRGAYSVRVIAGLLQNYGLLKKEYEAESARVIKAFQNLFPHDGSELEDGAGAAEQRQRLEEAYDIREHQSAAAPIHFMGIFDTVSSVGWLWDPKSFPNTLNMPNVTILRHALAVDERRAKFRTNRVKLEQGRNHRQMWFAGVHSDVGGGYKPPRNKLSRVPLRWMLGEAKAAGMNTVPDVERALGLDATYLEDEQAEQNESLTALWCPVELLPLPHREKTNSGWVDSRRIYRGKGWREIPETFDAHESLKRRKTPVKNTHWRDAESRINYQS
jgi:uncharacterized protein (DUF2235 family)